MFLRHLCQGVLVGLVFSLPVFHAQRQPPQLHQHALLVKLIHHLLDRVARKRICPRIPVAVNIEPAIIQRRPLDPKLLQLRNRSQHLCRRNVELIAPSAPTHVVCFARRLRNFPSLFLQHARPHPQRLIKIAAVYRQKTARDGITLARLEHRVRRNRHARLHPPVGLHLHRNRKCPRQRLDMPNRLAH